VLPGHFHSRETNHFMPRRKSTTPSVDELLAAMHRHAEEHRQIITNQLRSTILPRLHQLGVLRVRVDYSGYGDDGAIDSIDFDGADDTAIDVEKADPALVNDLRDAVSMFLPEGFETGEGGHGDLTIDVVTGKLTLDHGENFTETRSTTREFSL
jgi:hypothetical protein